MRMDFIFLALFIFDKEWEEKMKRCTCQQKLDTKKQKLDSQKGYLFHDPLDNEPRAA